MSLLNDWKSLFIHKKSSFIHKISSFIHKKSLLSDWKSSLIHKKDSFINKMRSCQALTQSFISKTKLGMKVNSGEINLKRHMSRIS